MSIVTKAGTLRYRGVTRAQLKQTVARLRSLLAYNAKVANFHPPLTFLSAPDAVTISALITTLNGYIAFRNPG